MNEKVSRSMDIAIEQCRIAGKSIEDRTGLLVWIRRMGFDVRGGVECRYGIRARDHNVILGEVTVFLDTVSRTGGVVSSSFRDTSDAMNRWTFDLGSSTPAETVDPVAQAETDNPVFVWVRCSNNYCHRTVSWLTVAPINDKRCACGSIVKICRVFMCESGCCEIKRFLSARNDPGDSFVRCPKCDGPTHKVIPSDWE